MKEGMEEGIHLSVVLPAFQEAARIRETLSDVLGYLKSVPYRSEVIVVDDGSTDATANVVAEISQGFPALRLVKHETNRGKGAAVRTGMEAAGGTFALFSDADNSTPIREAEKLLVAMENDVDIAIGSRYLPGSNVVEKQPIVRVFMSRVGNLLFRTLLGLQFADTRCGFKMYTRRAREAVFGRQTLERWGFDTELLVIAQVQGLRVVEVPVEWHDKLRGNIRMGRDSIRSIQEIIHIRKLRTQGAYA